MRVGPNTLERYSGVAQTLHWVIALLVISMFVLGLSLDNYKGAEKLWWVNIHTTAGLVLFALVILRLFWRIGHRPPSMPEGTSDLVRVSGTSTHHLMYLLLFAGPIVGIVAYVWHGRVFDFGQFKVDLGVASTKTIYEPAEVYHKYLIFTLMGLVGLHVLASLWHHFIRRDGLLWRMLPGGR